MSAGAITLKPNKYCVYRHRVNGVVIYVGKGKAGRPFLVNRFGARNKGWAAVVADEIEVEILGWYDSEHEALLAELEEIKRSRPTCNVRDVGVTPNLNIAISEELRTEIRIACLKAGMQVKEWVPMVLAEFLTRGRGGMADTPALKAGAEFERAGSTPADRTRFEEK